jgi:hypothetical protein
VLVGKGYFDKVVAPRGEITPGEVTLILKDYLKPVRKSGGDSPSRQV